MLPSIAHFYQKTLHGHPPFAESPSLHATRYKERGSYLYNTIFGASYHSLPIGTHMKATYTPGMASQPPPNQYRLPFCGSFDIDYPHLYMTSSRTLRIHRTQHQWNTASL